MRTLKAIHPSRVRTWYAEREPHDFRVILLSGAKKNGRPTIQVVTLPLLLESDESADGRGGTMKHPSVSASAALTTLLIAVVAGMYASAGCGATSNTSAGAPDATPEKSASASWSGNRLNLPTPDVMAALEGRISAWMRGDTQAAADFYAEDGVLREMDTSPDYVSEGRERIRWRLQDLYDAGLRLRPADAPLQYDRYVAEPTDFYPAEDESQAVVLMLVFEMDADNNIVYQWVPSGGGPVPEGHAAGTPAPGSPLTSRSNLPTREVARLLRKWMAALGRANGKAAAAYFTDDAIVREVDHAAGVVSTGRGQIAVRLQQLLDSGVRFEPAGASIQYGQMVAEPARVRLLDGTKSGACIFVLAVDAHTKITRLWVIGPVDSPN